MAAGKSPWFDFCDDSEYYTGPPLTDVMVADAEAMLGYNLPQSYLDLLRIKNGGVPRRQCHPTRGTTWSDNHVRVTRLCGIGGEWGIDSDDNGSQHAIRQAGFPEIGIFIGWTPTAGHDGIFLDYRECGRAGSPRVVYVDAEEGESGIQVLAPDFASFVRGLVDCRPYEDAREQAMEEYRQRMRKQG